jgi:hypothetical protein
LPMGCSPHAAKPATNGWAVFTADNPNP